MTRICALENTPLAREHEGLDACVHCGFCLQACPTYLTIEDENDSPRGRIVLMRSFLDGTLEASDPDSQRHIAQCLGCRACETACPSGVPYGHLLEATRASIGTTQRLPWYIRLLLWMVARPAVWHPFMALTRFFAATPLPTLAAQLPNRYGFAMAMLASTEFPLERGSYTPEPTEDRGTATLLRGCVMDGLFEETNRATVRVLQHNGYTMAATPHQTCCGALHAHTGDLETARKLARKNIAAFERTNTEYVVTNSAGCGAMLKEYAHLLRDDEAWYERARIFAANVRDVSELLDHAGPKGGGPLPFRATYDAPCHLYHGQRITTAPLVMLAAIPALDLVPLRDSEQCCGSAGVYNLVEPDTSTDVLNLKLSNIYTTRASLVVTGNPGCLMHIGAGLLRAGMQAHAVHPVDLLDASYASGSPGE